MSKHNLHSAELNRLMAQQQADMNAASSEVMAFDEGTMATAIEIDYAELIHRSREGLAGYESRDDFEEAADAFFERWALNYEAMSRQEKGADLAVRRFKSARKLAL